MFFLFILFKLLILSFTISWCFLHLYTFVDDVQSLLIPCGFSIANLDLHWHEWNRYATNLENKRVELFDGPSEGVGEENVLLASGKQIL